MVYGALPVMMRIKTIQKQGVTIYYPEIYGLTDTQIQRKINRAIFDLTERLIDKQHAEQGFQQFDEMIGTFEIKTNERNILSLSLSNYAIAPQAAHGLTIQKSLTFNVESGHQYTLAELFKKNSNYVEVLSDIIKTQIHNRDIPILNSFTKIRRDQDFYIADKSLVIYFQLYEITPYYIGLPMFPISVFELESILNENGPLGIMAANN